MISGKRHPSSRGGGGDGGDGGDGHNPTHAATRIVRPSRNNNNKRPSIVPRRLLPSSSVPILLLLPLLLVCVWMRMAMRVLFDLPSVTIDDVSLGPMGQSSSSSSSSSSLISSSSSFPRTHDDSPRTLPMRLVSRDPGVAITSSTRGNLGPVTVLNQDPPGADWLKDRWQAASDMGGTAIPGRHWVLLDFSSSLDTNATATIGGGDGGGGEGDDGTTIFVSRIVLDWETAYANDYRIEGRLDPPPTSPSSVEGDADDDDGGWCTLYDGGKEDDGVLVASARRTTEEYGQSPGVKRKMPLHVVHSIDFGDVAHDDASASDGGGTAVIDDHDHNDDGRGCRKLRYLRVYIRRPARGWGVSLWQVDVYGAVLGRGVNSI